MPEAADKSKAKHKDKGARSAKESNFYKLMGEKYMIHY